MLKDSQANGGSSISLGGLPDSPPQIIMLLNDNARILWLNNERAGSSFDAVSDARGLSVHDLLHSGCGGDCSLGDVWHDAWSRLSSHDVQEWEISDRRLDKVLCCQLVRSPSRRGTEERRSARAIFTVKDITDFREVHRTLVSQKDELVQRLSERDIRLNEARKQLLRESEVHDLAREMLSQSRQKLRFLTTELTNAQENERRRIALDLHDGIAQRLGAVKYHVEIVERQLADKGCEQECDMLEAVVEQIRTTAEELRRITSNLIPLQFEDGGIEAALETLCDDFESRFSNVELHREFCISEGDIPELVMIAIYRVVQEAMQNILKHAKSDTVDVFVGWSDKCVLLQITDNGCGISKKELQGKLQPGSGLGISNMKERVEASAGTFEIESQPGKGTRITARWGEEVLGLLGSNEPVSDRVGGNG